MTNFPRLFELRAFEQPQADRDANHIGSPQRGNGRRARLALIGDDGEEKVAGPQQQAQQQPGRGILAPRLQAQRHRHKREGQADA